MPASEPLDSVIDRSLNYGRHHIRRFLDQIERGSPKVVLDIGAGRGEDLLIARSLDPAASLHAIEVFPEYQAALRERSIAVHALDIERDRFPFADESVDVVIANQILEHTKEIFWILHETTRVLRAGGHLIIGVPNLASLHNRLLLALGRQPTCIQNHSAHVRGFTKSDLVKLLAMGFPEGYSLRGFGGSNFYPFPPAIARPLARVCPNMAWGIFLLFRKERVYRDAFLVHPIAQRLETNFFVGADRSSEAS